MIDTQFATEVLNQIYEDADRDWLPFSYILGAVSYDRNDQLIGKTEAQRLDDAFHLAKFMLLAGDFEVGELTGGEDKPGSFVPYPGGFEEFRTIATQFFSRGGVEDIDLIAGVWFDKVQFGKKAPFVVEAVARLICA